MGRLRRRTVALDAAHYLELIETAVTARILGLKALPSVAKTVASIRTIR
jgi:hypothetical protein